MTILKNTEKVDMEPVRKKQSYADYKSSLTFSELISVIKFRKKYIFWVLGITLSITLMFHYLHHPTYKTKSSVLLQTSSNTATASEFILSRVSNKLSATDRIENYMRFLQSDSFMYSLAQSVKFHKDFESFNLTNPSDVKIGSGRFWQMAAKKLSGNKVNLTTSQDAVLYKVENIVKFLRKTIKFQTDYTFTINFEVETLDPYTSQTISNLATQEFMTITNAKGEEEIHELENFVREKLEETTKRLKESEIKLVNFKKKHSMISADATARVVSKKLLDIDSQLETAKLKLAENEKLINHYRFQQEKNIDRMISSTTKASTISKSQKIDILNDKLDRLKSQKGYLIKKGYSEKYWKIKELNESIDKTAKQLKYHLGDGNILLEEGNMSSKEAAKKLLMLKDENRLLKSKIGALTTARSQLDSQVADLPNLEQTQLMLEKQVSLEYDLFSTLKKKIAELEIQKVSQKKDIRIDQMAPLPGPSKRGSLPMKILFSMFVSVFFSSLIILSLEYLDPSVKYKSDLEDCDLFYLGEVPKIQTISKFSGRIKNNTRLKDCVIAESRPESLEAMSFKYIRAKLEGIKNRQKGGALKVTITSGSQGEGKSFTASNLATSLSQIGKKVLLMDCDFRRPTISKYFNLQPSGGLSDLLETDTTLDEVLHREVLFNLDVLTTGDYSTNSTELFSNDRFSLLLSYLSEEYDYIIIDTPPARAVVDAAIISTHTNLTVLIAKYRKTTKPSLAQTFNTLMQFSNSRVYGILNSAPASSDFMTYYAYPVASQGVSAVDYNKTSRFENVQFLNKLHGKKEKNKKQTG